MILTALLLTAPLHAQDTEEEEEEIEYRARTEIDFEAIDISGDLVKPQGALLLNRLSTSPSASPISATPGGAQDIAFFDRLLEAGQVPSTAQYTAEGLLSEHDLPVEGTCPRLLCVVGQATTASLTAQPGITHLAQIGFTSALTELPRPPLNLVVVVDTSGSMQGEPIETVRASLAVLQEQLRPSDQLTIVTFNNTASLLLPATSSSARQTGAISTLQSGGGTALDAGMSLGFSEARASRARFDGLTRVIVMTDQQPNIGSTSADGFMARASAAAEDGIGMTLIGVSAHFGAALASQVSTVRGANLFYFADLEKMQQKFEEELGTMMVPLAYGMVLQIQPADGVEIEGIYGLPGSAIEWTEQGGIRMEVATLFPSKGGGGIFLGFSGQQSELGSISLAYDPLDGPPVQTEIDLTAVPDRRAWVGLARGAALVDIYTSLTRITTAYHDDDEESAYDLAVALLGRLPRDSALAEDRERITRLMSLMDAQSGVSQRDPMTGLPPR